MKLSMNLSLSEVLVSQTAKRLQISNEPTKEHLNNLKQIANNIFQPLRDGLGYPIYVSSGYRSEALNKAIKGSSKTSQHMKGQALDLDADVYKGVTNKDIFLFIRDNLDFDQLILECVGDDGTGGWVHVSYSEGKNRGKVMTAERINGRIKYFKYV
jgi:zinc D-Ala-D-Ala carboxypeptidase